MSDAVEATPGVAVTINGVEVVAKPGELVIEAAERNGTYIPRFCYHPRMSSVGMCRQCLVNIDTGRGPGLQPSCMISVSDGMVVDTESESVKRAQEGILELLLVNHPLDCPVCDKGGECPLQDQTLAFGPGESRFVEEKRHYEKPIPISDLVYLDRERCILCDRCTRFAREVAGDPLISFMQRGNQTQVLTFPDDPFNSYFSGNTVQICPVGALTAKPYRFRARPWDLAEVESTCTTCSVGCRVAVQSSRNELLRYQGVDIESVNHGWLCDKGRFGFEAVNSDQRLTQPYVRNGANDAELVGTDWNSALDAAAEALRAANGSVGVIGGARLSNENAYAWSKFARTVLDTNNVDAQLGDGLTAEMLLALPRATINEAASADHVLLLGPDLKEELPVLYLRLRGASENATKLVELAPVPTGLTKYAKVAHTYRPGELAHAVNELMAGPLGQEMASGRTVVVVGRPSLADSSAEVEQAVAVLLEKLPEATFLPVLRRGNVFGAIDMGLAPGLLPGRIANDEAGRQWYASKWSNVAANQGMDTIAMLEAAASGRLHTLLLIGSDPLSDVPDRDLVERAFAGVAEVIAVDTFANASVRRAGVVLPTSTFAEAGGTTTNIEGRVSTLGYMVTAPGTVRDDWTIAAELAWRLGSDLHLESLQDIWDEIEALAPSHFGCTAELLAADSEGVLVPLPKPA
ncbi:MAG: NADH-quinone oxidoreductase subunit NuoG, partial [Acidimicrobiales bacterium]|nr:NADH-quinone oxidoreductase subunit NuoG [Acidimicrobiales bacterium]